MAGFSNAVLHTIMQQLRKFQLIHRASHGPSSTSLLLAASRSEGGSINTSRRSSCCCYYAYFSSCRYRSADLSSLLINSTMVPSILNVAILGSHTLPARRNHRNHFRSWPKVSRITFGAYWHWILQRGYYTSIRVLVWGMFCAAF